MSSWKTALDQVRALLEEIALDSENEAISKELKAKILKCHEIVSAQEDFIDSSIPPQSQILTKVVQETQKDPKTSKLAIMLSGNIVGHLLKTVAELAKAKNILEIGTFTGYSAIALADSAFCEQVISLDIEEHSKDFVEKIIRGTPFQNKIEVVIGPAIESLSNICNQNKRFDLVFIDADKVSYINYYKFIMNNQLLNPNGVILCDNILYGNDTIARTGPKTPGGVALFEFVKFVKNDDRVEQIIFPFRDGVMLIKQKPL